MLCSEIRKLCGYVCRGDRLGARGYSGLAGTDGEPMSDDGLLGRVKQKLIETKQKWAGEGRLLTGVAADPGTRSSGCLPGWQANCPPTRWR